MAEYPDARWSSPENLPNHVEQHPASRKHSGPPTPQQRRLGNRIALGVMLAALLVIILLDHYGILH
ncbi:MAG: hypothetical protein WBY53_02875 [Acidobacteriaceae bacterium]